jgi:hypothetical protein
MNDDRWNQSTPTAPGDYAASRERDATCRRHWNGEWWSAPWYADDPAENIERVRRMPADTVAGDRPIEWQPLPVAVEAVAL